MRVEVKPAMLRWACERAGVDKEELTARMPKYPEWERGEAKPTLKQLEQFAHRVHVPVGFMFLPAPPREEVPIPDFRTVGSRYIGHPSPDLLETIYICQQRQEWYRNYALGMGEDPCPFVGAAKPRDDVVQAAARIRRGIGFDVEARSTMRTWQDALRRFIEQVDEAGLLVMVNGVVGNNNNRKLDPDEFRGFALSDPLAPLVFLNGADTKSGQMFTLAHELAHIWLGQTALSDTEPIGYPSHQIEKWCNEVAAEMLVPIEALHAVYGNRPDEVSRLAAYFKVSTLVILRRLHDAGYLSRDDLWAAYHAELERLMALRRSGGGNYYHMQAARVSRRFASAVVSSTLEGRASFTETFRMLGIKKMGTFREMARVLGVA